MKNYNGFNTVWIYGYLLVIGLTIGTAKVSAQDSTATAYQKNLIALPALGSSPETSFIFGGVGIYQFKIGDLQAGTRTSSIVGVGIYTLNNQSTFALESALILEGESWILNGMYAYSYFPEAFWGVGSNTSDDNEVRFIYNQVFLSQSALKQVAPKLFIGPTVRWTRNYKIRFENLDGDPIDSPSYRGTEDYSATGLGFTILWDKRDKTMTPTKNHMLEFTMMSNPSWLSTIDSYATYLFDARKYFDFSQNRGKSVLAFQFISKFSSGNPPIKDVAILGGQNVLRGYYEGRFRDHHGAQIQAELRQNIRGRFGIALFTSAGQVWHSFDDMRLNDALISAGGGLRFNLNKKDPTNIRLDYGIGKNTSGFYITIGEAF